MHMSGGINVYETLIRIHGIDPSMLYSLVINNTELSLPPTDTQLSNWNGIYLRKPFLPNELWQTAKMLATAWNLHQRQKKYENNLFPFIGSLSKLKTIQMPDLLELITTLFSQVLDFMQSSGGFLIVKEKNGQTEYLIGTMREKKNQIQQNPWIKASMDLLSQDHQSKSGPVVMKINDLSAVSIFANDMHLAAFVRCSRLTSKQETILKSFIKNTIKAIHTAKEQKKKQDLVFNLQNKNTELKKINEQLNNNTEEVKRLYDTYILDEVTQLYNFIHFHNILQNEFLRHHRYQRGRQNATQKGLALLMIDIDDFKFYNEMNGVNEGDLILKLIAKIISQRLRVTDFIARHTKDSFAIFLHEITPLDTYKVSDDLRARIEDYPFPKGEKQPGSKLTVSIGISHMINGYATKEELIKVAENRLLEAKNNGKNCVKCDFSIKAQ